MNLLILGAGGHGQVVREIALSTNQYSKIAFLDDASDNPFVIGKLEDYKTNRGNFDHAVVALGNNLLRLEWMDKLKDEGYCLPVLIHPTAYISPSAIIHEGTVVEAMAAINTAAQVHKGSIIDLGALIDHDAVIEAGCHVDIRAVVKAYVRVERATKVDACAVIRKF